MTKIEIAFQFLTLTLMVMNLHIRFLESEMDRFFRWDQRVLLSCHWKNLAYFSRHLSAPWNPENLSRLYLNSSSESYFSFITFYRFYVSQISHFKLKFQIYFHANIKDKHLLKKFFKVMDSRSSKLFTRTKKISGKKVFYAFQKIYFKNNI